MHIIQAYQPDHSDHPTLITPITLTTLTPWPPLPPDHSYNLDHPTNSTWNKCCLQIVWNHKLQKKLSQKTNLQNLIWNDYLKKGSSSTIKEHSLRLVAKNCHSWPKNSLELEWKLAKKSCLQQFAKIAVQNKAKFLELCLKWWLTKIEETNCPQQQFARFEEKNCLECTAAKKVFWKLCCIFVAAIRLILVIVN